MRREHSWAGLLSYNWRMETIASLPLTEMLTRLGSKEPAPGGGAAAAVVGAISAGLASMVVAYSIDKKSLAEHREKLSTASSLLVEIRTKLLEFADKDAEAYAGLNELWSLPKDDPKRVEKWDSALDLAIMVPLGIMEAGSELMNVYEKIAPISNPNLHSDLASAAAMCHASVISAGHSVRVNAEMLEDAGRKAEVLDDLQRRIENAVDKLVTVEEACEV